MNDGKAYLMDDAFQRYLNYQPYDAIQSHDEVA
jgi:hypothetical protein